MKQSEAIGHVAVWTAACCVSFAMPVLLPIMICVVCIYSVKSV